MASINASTSGGGGIITTADATGNLDIQSGGSTVVGVTSTGVAVTGTLSATGAITGSSTVAGSTGILYPLTSGTAVASTSGTSIDFTSIPSWVKRITVMFSGVSTNSTGRLRMQIGSGSVSTSGYTSIANYAGASTGAITSTAGLAWEAAGEANELRYGTMTINLLTGTTWVSSGSGGISQGALYYGVTSGGVSPALSGALDRVRISTDSADTFDAGSVNIMYE
jgi:hypothetical protein